MAMYFRENVMLYNFFEDTFIILYHELERVIIEYFHFFKENVTNAASIRIKIHKKCSNMSIAYSIKAGFQSTSTWVWFVFKFSPSSGSNSIIDNY